jgi:Protein of unknown function (DUF2799)
MKKLIGIISTVTIIFMLAGCASVSKEDCLVADWFENGRMDGIQGKSRTEFQNRAKPCLEHGVSADRQAYYKGHDDGLTYYCTEQKGFELGRKGLSYTSVCPLELEKDFRAGYQNGMQLFCSEESGFELGRRGRAYRYVCPPEFEPDFRTGYLKGRELYQYESKIASLQRRLKKIERKITKKEKQLYSENLSDEQRTEIRSELKSLDLDYRDVSRELKYMAKTKPIAQAY